MVFNLVLDLPDALPAQSGGVMGIDLGENHLATTSCGKIFGGGQLRYERDRYLNFRKRLQSNGSQSAKQLFKQVSGQERRHVTHVNHEISKAIVNEVLNNKISAIVMEDLTHIRKRIKAGKRVRSRLHRWPWHELQPFIEYKARGQGIQVIYVNPAYTSKTCSICGSIGIRSKHRFTCSSCGQRAHSDLNASRNIARLVESADSPRGNVTCPYVAAI